MKRFIFAVVALCIVVTVCIVSQISLTRHYRHMEALISESVGFAENGHMDEAGKKLNEAQQLWRESERWMGVLSAYGSIHQVDEMLARNQQHLVNGNLDEFLVESRAIQAQIRQLIERQQFTASNIF